MKPEITELYRVFQAYRLGPDFAGCSHCVDPDDTERLANTELRKLSQPDLDSYSFNAMTTWGDVKHFKHFLPRLFEIASTNDDDFLSTEVLFGKLAYANWHEWPNPEQHAIDRFLHAFWELAITADLTAADDESIDTALCSIGNACTAITPFLDEWSCSTARNAPRQLAQFVLLNLHDMTQHQRLANSYWAGRLDPAQQILAWLRLPTTYQYLCENQSRLNFRLSESVSVLASI